MIDATTFDALLHEASNEFTDNFQAGIKKFYSQMTEIAEKAVSDGIAEHLVIASVTHAIEEMTERFQQIQAEVQAL